MEAKTQYAAPAVEVVEVKMEVNILSNMGTEDYIFGGLDE